MASTASDVRHARERLGLGRKALAEASGVSERTINRIEAGDIVRASSLEPVLRFLRLTAEAEQSGPRLHEASNVELLAEVARRIAAVDNSDRPLPPVPEVRLSWPRSAAPSAAEYQSDTANGAGRST